MPAVLIQLGAPEAVKATVWLNRSVWSPSFVGSQIMNFPSPPSGRLAKKEKPEIVVVVDTDTPWPKPSSEGRLLTPLVGLRSKITPACAGTHAAAIVAANAAAKSFPVMRIPKTK